MNDRYPLGVVASAIRSSIGATLAAYLLFVAGTVIGVTAATGFQAWDWQFVIFLAFVIPYLVILTVTHPLLALLTVPVVVVAWCVCIYAESMKLRIGMLALIFGVAFGDTYYTLMAAE